MNYCQRVTYIPTLGKVPIDGQQLLTDVSRKG